MNLQQQSALKKIMTEFGRNFAESEMMHQRHTEMINAVNLSDVERAMDSLLRCGVRQEVLTAAMESAEFEEVVGAFVSEMTRIVNDWDTADQIWLQRAVA